MFASLLIANRGEIACRIIRTCRRLGVRAIAVYSEADAGARHVREADDAVPIGPAPARDSYLDADRIMAAAARSGAEAIHPGYGFLSEKPDLADRCEAAGLVFVGPSADRIHAMGSKIGAKQIAVSAGVATVPGYSGEEQSPGRLSEAALRLGFPLMIKASAGGGGKGMRRVFAREDLGAALDLARQEAEAAFGDPALLLERLVMRPRHLEVQVAGDRHGNVIHLFERDCSVQRNHQKLIEEAPAPHLDRQVHERLLANAVALAHAISYDNLGTIEFILEGGQEEPWFLEMNARLQVEHTVTEAITGLDLVEWQCRIAAGEPLPLRQEEIRIAGHAIEARVTAESAHLGFRPDVGTIAAMREPAGVRVDSGIARESKISPHYDSLLAKIIAVGDTREAARLRLRTALLDFVVLGPVTTLAFLADAIAAPAFVEGRATTAFLDEVFPQGWAPPSTNRRLAQAVAAVTYATELRRTDRLSPRSPWAWLTGFRVLAPAGGMATFSLMLTEAGETTLVRVEATHPGHRVLFSDGAIDIVLEIDGDTFAVLAEGRQRSGMFAIGQDEVSLWLAGETYTFRLQPQVRVTNAAQQSVASQGAVLVPMPGVIAEVRVANGDMVEIGQVVAVLESMKLLVPLAASQPGTVADLDCRRGDNVGPGRRLMRIEPTGDRDTAGTEPEEARTRS